MKYRNFGSKTKSTRENCLTEENEKLKRIIAEQSTDLRRVASVMRTLYLNNTSPSGYEREFMMKEHMLLTSKFYLD